MKKLILFFISIAVFTVVSCDEKGSTLGPKKPISREDSIKIELLKPSPTKEPYIVLEDAGLEAELIAQGKDTDNQINGKISVEDADRIEILGKPVLIEVNSEEASYYGPIYSRYFEVMPILKKEYKEKTGTELIVKKLSDVNAFKNLIKLYITFPTETIDSLSLSANNRLEVFETFDTRIKVIDFNGCQQIKKINFTKSPHPLVGNLLDKIHISQCSKLEYLSFVSVDLRNLDISKNVNLKHLELQTMSSPPQTEVEKLDLCNHSRLEYLKVVSGYYGSICLTRNVYAFYLAGKQQNASNGFPELNYSRGEVRACE